MISINPMAIAIIQMMQPHDVAQPSDKKSRIQFIIFRTHPKRLKPRRVRIMKDMMPTIPIIE